MMKIEQRLRVYWFIRYFSEEEHRVKKRTLFLDTALMPAGVAHAFMFLVEAEDLLHSWQLRDYKSYFSEVSDYESHLEKQMKTHFDIRHTPGPNGYFESEKGEVLSESTVLRLLGKKPNVSFGCLERYLKSEKDTVVEFDEKTKLQLRFFSRNYRELLKAPLQAPSLSIDGGRYFVELMTPEAEMKAYVQTFRKLYIHDGQAGGSFGDLCDDLLRYPNSSLSVLAKDSKAEFEMLKNIQFKTIAEEKNINLGLGAPCIYKLFKDYPEAITVHKFVQVYLNTKFMHNPNPARDKTWNELVAFLKRDEAEVILSYIFVSILLRFRVLFHNAGQVFVGVSEHCNPPDNPIPIGRTGCDSRSVGRKAVFEKMKKSLANQLWIEKERPPEGPYCFEDEAERQILNALGRASID